MSTFLIFVPLLVSFVVNDDLMKADVPQKLGSSLMFPSASSWIHSCSSDAAEQNMNHLHSFPLDEELQRESTRRRRHQQSCRRRSWFLGTTRSTVQEPKETKMQFKWKKCCPVVHQQIRVHMKEDQQRREADDLEKETKSNLLR